MLIELERRTYFDSVDFLHRFLLIWCFMKWNLLVNPKLSPLLQINSRRYKTADTWKRRLKFTKAENEQSFSSHCNFIKLWWPTITTLTLFCNIFLFKNDVYILSKKSTLRRKQFIMYLVSRMWNIFKHMILKSFLSNSLFNYLVDIYFMVYLWSSKENLIVKVI